MKPLATVSRSHDGRLPIDHLYSARARPRVGSMRVKQRDGLEADALVRCVTALAGLMLAACATTAPAEPTPGQIAQAQSVVSGNTYTATFPLPASLAAQQVVLAADGVLDLRDRSKLASANGAPPATNMGAGSTTVGAEAWSSSLLSKPSVSLRDRAKVFGDITTGGSLVRGNDTLVTGVITQQSNLPAKEIVFRATFPASTRGDVMIEPGQTTPLDPGRNSNVNIKSTATLSLKSGVYYFDALTLESQANLRLDETAGPVELYIKHGFTFRGTVATTAAPPELLIVDFGSSTVFIEAPFRGNIIAPSARIVLGTTAVGHTGAFFAKELELQADTTVTHRPSVALVPLRPLAPCIRPLGPGQFEAVFGYENVGNRRIDYVVGAQNRFTASPVGRGQPESFVPHRVEAAFAVIFNGAPISWSLAGRTVTASSSSPACPAASCSECGEARTCVGSSCIPVCGDGQCALAETCKTCSADCGCSGTAVCQDSGGCATPARCGFDWECGAGTSLGTSLDCGACPPGKACVLHACR